MDLQRIRERGIVALVVAFGILLLTTAFSFWRVHEDEKVMEAGQSSKWDTCINNCMEEK